MWPQIFVQRRLILVGRFSPSAFLAQLASLCLLKTQRIETIAALIWISLWLA
jgi:hypothetical protein